MVEEFMSVSTQFTQKKHFRACLYSIIYLKITTILTLLIKALLTFQTNVIFRVSNDEELRKISGPNNEEARAR
jgi:membrane-anchored glycerophosphoryl diester phosphodiesterase (GDPDase)